MKIQVVAALAFALGAGWWPPAAAQDGLSAREILRREAGSGGAPFAVWRQSHGIARMGGALWGAGADYKVLFRDGGIDFHPALGRRVARNAPLSFELESIRRGREILYVVAQPVTPAREGNAVRYHHGAGVIESYEVRADGVEQSFTFAAPLPGTGELVVRGRIASDLAAPLPGRYGDGLAFALDGIGGGRVGGVTGVDAAGRTARGELRSEGAQLELVLPADFVAEAAWPLVLDPLIGTHFGVGGTTYDDIDPDVAYDDTHDLYLVAWQREYSATDVDIRGQRVSSSGSLVGGMIPIETSIPKVALHPTVANVNVSDRFLVAWQQSDSIFGPYDIIGRAVDASDGATSVLTVTIAAGSASEIDPDAAGEPTDLDDDALVVWEETGGGIKGRQVSVPVTGNPTALGAFTLTTSSAVSRPSIAKCTDKAGAHLVVWQRLFTGTSADHDIRAALIDRDGSILAPDTFVVSSSGPDETDADVDGDGSSWLVVYEREAALGAGDSDVRAIRATWTGTDLIFDDEVVLAGAAGSNEVDPAVAFAGPKYMVAWSHRHSGFEYDLYVMGVNPTTCEVCEPATMVFFSGFEHGPEMASQLSGSTAAGDEVLLVWCSGSTVPPFDGDVKAQILEAIGPGGSSPSLGVGCGGGGYFTTSGAIAVGNPDLAFELSGADSAATVGLILVRLPGATYTCGSCTFLLPPGIQLSAALAGGSATLTVPVPCQGSLDGATLEAQWAVLPTSSSPCSLFPNISFSNRRSLTFGL